MQHEVTTLRHGLVFSCEMIPREMGAARTTMRAFLSRARDMHSSWRSPTDILLPLSATLASSEPTFSRMFTVSTAAHTSSSLRPSGVSD